MLHLALIGRPNVGKSTLFNRLVGKRIAIVDDMPGVTRDRRQMQGNLGSLSFMVTDTAGLEQEAETGTLTDYMMQQTRVAIAEADIILMMVDGRSGIIPADEHFTREIRKSGKPVILIVNKCEATAVAREGFAEAFRLGLGEPVLVSAEHGDGMADLYDRLVSEAEQHNLDIESDDTPPGDQLFIAIAGRPNVGKSTFFNALLKEERSIASEVAGTTRDAIYVDWEYMGKPVKLVDTAGMRKRAKRTDILEKKSVDDSYRAIRFANVVILMVDAADPMNKIDLQLADYILSEGRGLIIAVNKWDSIVEKKETLENIQTTLEYSLAQAKGVPVITLSALHGKNIDRVMQEALAILERWNMRITTGKLNRWLEQVQERHTPPLVKGRRVRFRYITQAKARPPTFILFTSSAVENLPESYVRYLSASLRETFGLAGVPLRLTVRKGKNPFESDKPRSGNAPRKGRKH